MHTKHMKIATKEKNRIETKKKLAIKRHTICLKFWIGNKARISLNFLCIYFYESLRKSIIKKGYRERSNFWNCEQNVVQIAFFPRFFFTMIFHESRKKSVDLMRKFKFVIWVALHADTRRQERSGDRKRNFMYSQHHHQTLLWGVELKLKFGAPLQSASQRVEWNEGENVLSIFEMYKNIKFYGFSREEFYDKHKSFLSCNNLFHLHYNFN